MYKSLAEPGSLQFPNCPLLLVDASHKLKIHVSVHLLTMEVSQWARNNFCSYRKNIFSSFFNSSSFPLEHTALITSFHLSRSLAALFVAPPPRSCWWSSVQLVEFFSKSSVVFLSPVSPVASIPRLGGWILSALGVGYVQFIPTFYSG